VIAFFIKIGAVKAARNLRA